MLIDKIKEKASETFHKVPLSRKVFQHLQNRRFFHLVLMQFRQVSDPLRNRFVSATRHWSDQKTQKLKKKK